MSACLDHSRKRARIADMKAFSLVRQLYPLALMPGISKLSVRSLRLGLMFSPAVLVVLSGAALFFAPRLALMILAVFLICAGCGLVALTVFLLRFKRKLDVFARQLQGRVVLHGISVREDAPVSSEETGKIILH